MDGNEFDGLVRLTKVTTVHGSFAARVLHARLIDEGIDAQLRGPVDMPYGFTVGDLAKVDVYVPDDQVDDASLVLLANAVDDATELPEPRVRVGVRWAATACVLAIVMAAVSPIVRYVD